ncbi:MAG TPA: VOC family protein [Pyrinomonadaceae bacterium]|jgi:hypothetical protein
MAPTLYRIILQVDNLDRAEEFYGTLLGDRGRRIPRGSRHYIDCGPVILALVDVNGEGIAGLEPKPLPDYIYFSVSDIESFHQRARELNCLSTEDVHGEPAGEIVVRPWRERSFYANDPWGNGLCFVDENTLFTGR